jgi:hypothetical protein
MARKKKRKVNPWAVANAMVKKGQVSPRKKERVVKAIKRRAR